MMEKNNKLISKKYLVLGAFFFVLSCSENKGEYKDTQSLSSCDGIYIENYRTFGGGGIGGDMLSEYITDSANFRIHVGIFEDTYGHFSYKCVSDSIRIYNCHASDTSQHQRCLDSTSYSINELKKVKNINEDKILEIDNLRSNTKK